MTIADLVISEQIRRSKYDLWFCELQRISSKTIEKEGIAHDLFLDGATPEEAIQEILSY